MLHELFCKLDRACLRSRLYKLDTVSSILVTWSRPAVRACVCVCVTGPKYNGFSPRNHCQSPVSPMPFPAETHPSVVSRPAGGRLLHRPHWPRRRLGGRHQGARVRDPSRAGGGGHGAAQRSTTECACGDAYGACHGRRGGAREEEVHPARQHGQRGVENGEHFGAQHGPHHRGEAGGDGPLFTVDPVGRGKGDGRAKPRQWGWAAMPE